MITVSGVILLVEDNPDDVFLMHRALKKTGLRFPLQIAGDGRQALEYLSGAGEHGDRNRFPFPSLLFLDLKLPNVTGFEDFFTEAAGQGKSRSIRGQGVLGKTAFLQDIDRGPHGRDPGRAKYVFKASPARGRT